MRNITIPKKALAAFTQGTSYQRGDIYVRELYTTRLEHGTGFTRTLQRHGFNVAYTERTGEVYDSNLWEVWAPCCVGYHLDAINKIMGCMREGVSLRLAPDDMTIEVVQSGKVIARESRFSAGLIIPVPHMA